MVALLAAALLLSAGDPPEPQLDMAPLVPASPAAKPVKKKKKKKPAQTLKAPPASPGKAGVEAELPLPPLVAPPPGASPPELPSQVPPAPPLIKDLNEVGVIVRMDAPDPALEQRLAEGVQGIVRMAPRV